MKTYFANINTAEELKKEFRRLSIELHPDRNGGQDAEFKAMLQAYEQEQNRINGVHTEFKHRRRPSGVALRRGAFLRCDWGAGCADYYAVYLGNNKMVRIFSHDFDSVESVKGSYYDETDRGFIHVTAEYVCPLSDRYGVGVYIVDGEHAKTYTEEEIQILCMYADNFDKWQKIRKEERQAEEARQEAARKAEERQKMAVWVNRLTKCEPLTAKDWKERGKQEQKRKNVMKKNVRIILSFYFPGVKFTVKDSGSSWGASSSIEWQDGPTVPEVEAIEEITRFTGYTWYFDNTDYSERRGCASWKEWREMFGEFADEKIKYERTTSEATNNAINEALEAMGAEWEGRDNENKITRVTGSACLDSLQIEKFIKALGEEVHDEDGKRTACASAIYKYYNYCDWVDSTRHRVYACELVKLARKYYSIPQAQQEAQAAEDNAPKFTAHHGKQYRDIIKALGGNKFVCLTDGKEWDELTELSPLEAAEALAKGERVGLGKVWEYNGRNVSRVDAGGRKTQEKRRDKFAAVGFGVVVTWSCYKGVEFDSVTSETLEALRQDAAKVEQQRKEWEKAHNAPKAAQTTTRKEAPQKAQNEPTGAAPAEGLQLVEIAEGVAVVGDTRTTYRNRKEIKAHGAQWNKTAQRWEATTPEAVASLRHWFGLSDDEQIQSETTTEETTAEDITDNTTDTQSEPQQETTTEGAQVETMGEDLAQAFADFLNVCGEIRVCNLWGDSEPTTDDTTEEATEGAQERTTEAEQTTTPTEAENDTQSEPHAERIYFAVDDVPELDELHDITEPTDPCSTPTGGAPEGDEIGLNDEEKFNHRFANYWQALRPWGALCDLLQIMIKADSKTALKTLRDYEPNEGETLAESAANILCQIAAHHDAQGKKCFYPHACRMRQFITQGRTAERLKATA